MDDKATVRHLRNRNSTCSKRAEPYLRIFLELTEDEQEYVAGMIDWLRQELSCGKLSRFGIWSGLELFGRIYWDEWHKYTVEEKEDN